MAMWQQNNTNVREIGATVTVPENDVARCMYYLSCVTAVVDCDDDDDMSEYTDYRNYRYLSANDIQIVYRLCLSLSPDKFDDKVFFESDRLCGSSANNFFEISQVQHRLGVVGSILIAGRQRQVTKIMTYKMSWMQKNYYGPMNRLADRLNPERQLLRALQQTDCRIS